MEYVRKSYTVSDFEKYIAEYDFGSIPPTKIYIHHTWKPKKDEWNGVETLDGIKNYYQNTKGWPASPHLFIAEDGIWEMTPLRNLGVHAGSGNSYWKNGRLTGYSIGIEIVGDYDDDVWSGKTKKNALNAISLLMARLGLTNEDVLFHRDTTPYKTCPGAQITKKWLFSELAKLKKAHAEEKPSSWAKDAWEWQKNLGLDLSVQPRQTVHAEWVFAILKKVNDIFKK